jgi:hypothetical protein
MGGGEDIEGGVGPRAHNCILEVAKHNRIDVKLRAGERHWGSSETAEGKPGSIGRHDGLESVMSYVSNISWAYLLWSRVIVRAARSLVTRMPMISERSPWYLMSKWDRTWVLKSMIY